MNTNLQELKDLIKAKAEYQVELKRNRKDVNFTGTRLNHTYKVWNKEERKFEEVVKPMHPQTAAMLVGGTYKPNGDPYYSFGNPGTKHELRLLYAAYGLLRGKSFSKTESAYPEETHPLNRYKSEIMEIVNLYKDEETVCTDK